MLLRFRLRNRLMQPGLSVSYPYRRRETAPCAAAAYPGAGVDRLRERGGRIEHGNVRHDG